MSVIKKIAAIAALAIASLGIVAPSASAQTTSAPVGANFYAPSSWDWG
jgi:invasion protein IalB